MGSWFKSDSTPKSDIVKAEIANRQNNRVHNRSYLAFIWRNVIGDYAEGDIESVRASYRTIRHILNSGDTFDTNWNSLSRRNLKREKLRRWITSFFIDFNRRRIYESLNHNFLAIIWSLCERKYGG